MRSFFRTDGDSFVFVGKDDMDAAVMGFIDMLHGFQKIASSTEEYNYLTRIKTDE